MKIVLPLEREHDFRKFVVSNSNRFLVQFWYQFGSIFRLKVGYNRKKYDIFGCQFLDNFSKLVLVDFGFLLGAKLEPCWHQKFSKRLQEAVRRLRFGSKGRSGRVLKMSFNTRRRPNPLKSSPGRAWGCPGGAWSRFSLIYDRFWVNF